MKYSLFDKLMKEKKSSSDSEEEWVSLNERQKVKQISTLDNADIFIIAPKNVEDLMVPFYCPLCELPMTTREDVLTYKQHKLCEHCHYTWNIPLNEAEGWKLDLNATKKTGAFKKYKKEITKKRNPKINLK